MSLKFSKPNPLNYFGIRQVDFLPPHFCSTTVDVNSQLAKKINFWIKDNLNSRYYIGQDLDLDHNNTIVYTTKIGFESEKELSFFMIACPYLK